MKISRERDLAASPADVGALVGDLSRWPEWFALHKGWAGDVPAAARVGTRFSHNVRVLGVPGQVTWEVVDLEEPHRYVLKGRGPSRTSMGLDVRVAGIAAGSRIAVDATLGGLLIKPVEGQLRTWLDVRVERTLTSLEGLLA